MVTHGLRSEDRVNVVLVLSAYRTMRLGIYKGLYVEHFQPITLEITFPVQPPSDFYLFSYHASTH